MIEFDIASVPFSTHGSWLNLSPIIGAHQRADDVHLVSHRGGTFAVLKLHVPQQHTVRAVPEALTWRTADGSIDAAFEGTQRVRLRGHNAALIVEDGQPNTPFRGSFQYIDPIDGSAVFSSNETGHRYRLELLAGEQEAVVDDTGRRAWRISGVDWEIAIEEFGTARAPRGPAPSFDEVVAASEADFQHYVSQVAPWRTSETPAAELAAYVLWASTVEPYGFVQRESVLMSKHWMDRVWSWDHCFNALALAPGLPQAAWDQFMMPFDHQDASGALPDTVGSYGASYGFVKPPVHGWTVARLLRDVPAWGAERRRQLMDRLASLTSFWLDYRRVPGHPVPHYQHGNDSGWDNSTAFRTEDVIESPDLAAMLAVQLGVLISMGEDLGDERVPEWRTQKTELLQALTVRFWDGTSLVARHVPDNAIAGQTSLLRLMALIAADDLPADIVDAIIDELPEFLTEWGVATEKPTSPYYEADGYWRGPIWAPPTILLEDGLRRAGRIELADAISARFRGLCERHGFAENFDALTGAGLRDLAYTWTASVYLVLAREHVAREQERSDQ